MQTISALEISATQIRELLKHELSTRYLLPDAVIAYIKQQKLYL
jgi:nicotinate-nucleotide adenylyltransferase